VAGAIEFRGAIFRSFQGYVISPDSVDDNPQDLLGENVLSKSWSRSTTWRSTRRSPALEFRIAPKSVVSAGGLKNILFRRSELLTEFGLE